MSLENLDETFLLSLTFSKIISNVRTCIVSYTILKTSLTDILPLRRLYLQENNFQVRYNACHERNWSDSFLIKHGNEAIGYGSVKGLDHLTDRDTVFEFYITPPYTTKSSEIFALLLKASGATFIECQSNDHLLTSLLLEFTTNIRSDVVLFKDDHATQISIPTIVFREKTETDVIFEHTTEPAGEYVLELNNEIIATGGFALHYNLPFADLYMEVHETHRRKGYGSYILQEIKKECYRHGRVPAARCDIHNVASRSALIRAGLTMTGFMLAGDVKN